MNNEVNKAIAGVHETLLQNNLTQNQNPELTERAYQVYTMSQLMGISGRDKKGQVLNGYYEQPIFYLSIEERISIFRLSSPVYSVVTSRMNRISGMKWKIVNDKTDEDRLYEKMKTLKQIFDEYAGATAFDLKYLVVRSQILKEIQNTLTEVLPDLSNFDRSLLRWHRRIKTQKNDECEWIADWMRQPNLNDKYEDLVKKQVADLLIHGAFAAYKEVINNRIENVYSLPGGTVMPMKNKYAGGAAAFVQIMQGYEPQIFFGDELAYFNYIPTTARAHGFVPLEALVNKLAETLLFDKLMADQADGTRMPEKMVVIANPSPFGDLDKEFSMPLNVDEQKRTETKLNQPIKGSIMTFSGNAVEVVDLSRENTMDIQMRRQKDIREEVGMVFQATPMEMGLSGSDDTSGRSTAEAQERQYHSSGILPIVKILETFWNYEILPFRFGTGKKFVIESEKSESENIDIIQKKMSTGIYSVNEIRVNDLSEDPFDDKQFDLPPQAQKPDGTDNNPLMVKNLE